MSKMSKAQELELRKAQAELEAYGREVDQQTTIQVLEETLNLFKSQPEKLQAKGPRTPAREPRRAQLDAKRQQYKQRVANALAQASYNGTIDETTSARLAHLLDTRGPDAVLEQAPEPLRQVIGHTPGRP